MMKILWQRMNKKLLAYSFGIAMVLPLCQLYGMLTKNFDQEKNIFLDSPYTLWMGVNSDHFTTMTYFLILPLLAAMPAATLLRKDMTSGFFLQLRIKESTKKVVTNYLIWSFLLGGLIVMLPLLTNFGGYFLTVPNIKPDNLMNINILVINKNTWLVSLYYAHPFFHVLLDLLLVFIWGGMFSIFVTGSSIFVKNRHFVFVFAFLLQLFLLIINATGLIDNSVSPSDFLNETAMANVNGNIIVLVTIIMLLLNSTLIRKGMRNIGDI